MSALDAVNYRAGQKTNWRRQVWNEIRDRLFVSPAAARVLYLAGEADRDRPVALSKGFKPDNLIAVESNRRVVRALRKRGVLCLHADISSALWALDCQFDVVIADFCCGMELDIAAGDFATALLRKSLHETVIALNVLRGRDGSSTAWRNEWAVKGAEKHRGAAFRHCHLEASFQYRDRSIVVGDDSLHSKPQADEDTRRFVKWARQIQASPKWCERMLSYRSTCGFQTFDTVIFRNPIAGPTPLSSEHARYQEFFEKTVFAPQRRHDKLRRQWAAISAHRTRRMQ